MALADLRAAANLRVMEYLSISKCLGGDGLRDFDAAAGCGYIRLSAEVEEAGCRCAAQGLHRGAGG